MKETIGIYPYNHNWKPILHYRDFLFPDTKLYAVVDPLEGNMEQYQDQIILYPQSSFNILMLTEKYKAKDIEKEILKFLQQGKKIENFQVLPPEVRQHLERNQNFNDYSVEPVNGFLPTVSTLSEIPVPVFFVLSLYEDLDKFAVQIALRKILKEKSLVVSQIGTRSYCERFGFHSFPQFMYKNIYTPEEKILHFNHYILDIVKRERSDVIVIGIPGAYNKLNLKFPMGFGILPYLISQAVTPDFSIMCTFYTEIEDGKLFEQLSVNCKHRLGFEVDCFHMSGTYIDVNALTDLGELKYIHLPDELPDKVVKTKLNRLGHTVFNIYHPDGEKILSDKLFATLSPPYEEVNLEW